MVVVAVVVEVAVAVAVAVAVVVVVGYLLVSFDVFVWVLSERGASHSSKGRGSVVIENRADQDSFFRCSAPQRRSASQSKA